MVGACIYIFERSIRLSENRHRSRAAPIPCAFDVSSLQKNPSFSSPSDLWFNRSQPKLGVLAPFSQKKKNCFSFRASRRYFRRKIGRERIEMSRPAKERRRELRTFLTEGIESPVFGPAKAKKESARARTNAPTFRATLYPPLSPFPSCFPLPRCRASAPKTCLYRAGCDWSVGPVIHRKRRMQTVT